MQMIGEPLEDYFWPVERVAPPREVVETNKMGEEREEVADSESCLDGRATLLRRDEIIVREDDDELIDKLGDDDDDEQMLTHRVDAVCAYLRRRHLYCVWCAVRFNDAQDLESNCPGLTFEAHEDI